MFTHKLKIKKLHPDATIPKYQSGEAAGFDLAACENATVYPSVITIVRTGLAFDIPKGYELQIRPRSGLAAKFGITVINSPGTVDSDYVDEVKVILTRIAGLILPPFEPFEIKAGDRIAQAVFAPIQQAELIEVTEFEETANEKDRGGGFGSTGV